jgi:LysM repeat protein
MAQKPKPRNLAGRVAAGVKGYQQGRARAVARGVESKRVAGQAAARSTVSSAAMKARSQSAARSAASARTTAQTGSKAAAPATAAGRKRVTVKAGDSLSAIAKREGVSLSALRQANKGRAVLDRIYSGSKVVIPGKKK